ncbi:MAG: DUF1439 domain-containing protein [Piscinibacter sp.]|uniref:DUF1439 domain-containing protein n=1 Tax=Piscinibacter TaxID=1114981 RepID=UPI000FDE8093|nr:MULTISPECIES: DUF1439 domain-containing protein [Piscinibacter]MCW5663310.1 DUF1439 domain-containing protein [Piscinibacter sp.]
MKRRFLLPAAAAVLLAGCAGVGGPTVLTLDEAELARLMAKNFPLERRALELFDLTLDAPRTTLLPQSNRLATELDLQAVERLSSRRYQGRMALDYRLRYDEAAQAVRLADVRVQRLQFDETAQRLQPVVERLGALLAEQLLRDAVIYRFKPEDLEKAGRRGVQPGAVTVTARGVEITLVPRP